MKILSGEAVGGQLDLPEGELEEGVTVTIMVPDAYAGFDLTAKQQASPPTTHFFLVVSGTSTFWRTDGEPYP